MKRLSILLILLAGCGSSAALPITFDAGYLRATIAILDADDASFVPDLPDDFGKKQGNIAPEPATEPLPPPVKVVPAPKDVPLIEIFYYSRANCPPCRNSEADQVCLTEYKFTKATPDVWSKKQTEGFPHFRWQVNGKWIGEAHGWYGPAWFKGLYEKSLKAEPVQAAPKQTRTVNQHPLFYGQKPSVWNWPGELRHHLTQPPHNYPRSRVDAMSDQEVIRAHDAWHNRYGATGHKRSPITVSRVCPV